MKQHLSIRSKKIKLTRSSCKHTAEYELLTSLVCSQSDSTCYRAVIRAGLRLSCYRAASVCHCQNCYP